MTKTIRIGCASGFWGDSYIAAPQLIEKGDIDYLVFDYLSEITMSIMGRAMMKAPNAGYAIDFVTVTMAAIARDVAAKKIKVIANAGGVNPLRRLRRFWPGRASLSRSPSSRATTSARSSRPGRRSA